MVLATAAASCFNPFMPVIVLVIVLGILGWLFWDLQQQVEQQNPAAAAVQSAAGYASALERARTENKPVLLIFTASWCGPCRQMKQQVYPSAPVQAVAERLIWVMLDVDDSRNQALARKYGVRSIPTLVIISSDERVQDKITGSRSPKDLAAWLQKNS